MVSITFKQWVIYVILLILLVVVITLFVYQTDYFINSTDSILTEDNTTTTESITTERVCERYETNYLNNDNVYLTSLNRFISSNLISYDISSIYEVELLSLVHDGIYYTKEAEVYRCPYNNTLDGCIIFKEDIEILNEEVELFFTNDKHSIDMHFIDIRNDNCYDNDCYVKNLTVGFKYCKDYKEISK